MQRIHMMAMRAKTAYVIKRLLQMFPSSRRHSTRMPERLSKLQRPCDKRTATRVAADLSPSILGCRYVGLLP